MLEPVVNLLEKIRLPRARERSCRHADGAAIMPAAIFFMAAP